MKIISPAFENKQMIPPKYTCDGENISPPLQISHIPANTQSLALIVDDPDAPNGDWVHWLVWNINPKTQSIAENEIPKGAAQGINDFNKRDYGGPCPPSNTHRYQFKIYALDTNLNITPNSQKRDLENSMKGHILDEDILIGLYQRV
jgi:Raf kinase inhibitor-like YbhB/YbcL family protein